MTTVIIKETCCCGAEFSVEDTASIGNSASYRYREFLEAHKVCREKYYGIPIQEEEYP